MEVRRETRTKSFAISPMRGSWLAWRIGHNLPRSPGTCAGRLDLTASIPNSARQCRISSNLTSSLLEAGLPQEPSFRRQGFCSCMRRLPRRSWKPQPRPVKGGTRQPFRREPIRQQESSSMVLSRLAGRRVAPYTPPKIRQALIEAIINLATKEITLTTDQPQLDDAHRA